MRRDPIGELGRGALVASEPIAELLEHEETEGALVERPIGAIAIGGTLLAVVEVRAPKSDLRRVQKLIDRRVKACEAETAHQVDRLAGRLERRTGRIGLERIAEHEALGGGRRLAAGDRRPSHESEMDAAEDLLAHGCVVDDRPPRIAPVDVIATPSPQLNSTACRPRSGTPSLPSKTGYQGSPSTSASPLTPSVPYRRGNSSSASKCRVSVSPAGSWGGCARSQMETRRRRPRTGSTRASGDRRARRET